MEREGRQEGKSRENKKTRVDRQQDGSRQEAYWNFSETHQKAGISMISWRVPTLFSLVSPALASDPSSARVSKGSDSKLCVGAWH